jgi:predicted nuclease of predicted toxin-antitoxin system
MPGRWLLDANIPTQLVLTLKDLGVEAASAASRGWKQLTNGNLVEAANNAGFSTILTRDRRFQQSASGTLKRFSAMALVVVVLPQAPARDFLRVFESSWAAKPIRPMAGQVITWP